DVDSDPAALGTAAIDDVGCRSANQKNKRCRSPDRAAAALLEGGRQKKCVSQRKHREPAPGKLHKGKFGQKLPKRPANVEHQKCGYGRKRQKRPPKGSQFAVLFGFGNSSVERDPREPEHEKDQDSGARSNPVER